MPTACHPGEWVRDQSLFRSRLNKEGALPAWQGGTPSPSFQLTLFHSRSRIATQRLPVVLRLRSLHTP
jgi:hypothetical protein